MRELFTRFRGGGGPITLVSMSQAAGADPVGELIMDSSGNLFGVSSVREALVPGSDFGPGQIYELMKGSSRITVLATFNGNIGPASNGFDPLTGLVMDTEGNFYGTASQGGPTGGGTVFELVRSSNTIKTILGTFNADTTGASPDSTLLMDSSGDLFGTTIQGGTKRILTARFSKSPPVPEL